MGKAKMPESPQQMQARIVKLVVSMVKAGKDGTTITQSLFGSFKLNDYRAVTDAIKEIESGNKATFPEWVGKEDREKIRALVKARPKIRRTRKLIAVLFLLGIVGGVCWKLFL